MDDDSPSDQLTIEQTIRVQICAIDVLIDTLAEYVNEPDPFFAQARNRLQSLLGQLHGNRIQPEYAEVEFWKIRDELDQRQDDNRMPDE